MNPRVKNDLELFLHRKAIDFDDLFKNPDQYQQRWGNYYKYIVDLIETFELDLDINVEHASTNGLVDKYIVKLNSSYESIISYDTISLNEFAEQVHKIMIPKDIKELIDRVQTGETFEIHIENEDCWYKYKGNLYKEFPDSINVYRNERFNCVIGDVRTFFTTKRNFRWITQVEQSHLLKLIGIEDENCIIVNGEKYYRNDQYISISMPCCFDAYVSKSGLIIFKAKKIRNDKGSI